MKKILVFVSTLDGKITQWGRSPVKDWTSEEDQQYFHKTWNDSTLIVMGSSTYNVAPMKPSPEHHLVIMTSTPDKYKDQEVAGQVEFTDKSPAQLVAHYEKLGVTQMTVVGGSHIATSFFKSECIDEVWLTIEPKIFGTGGSFVSEEKLNVNLELIEMEKVNEKGTLITKYAVIK